MIRFSSDLQLSDEARKLVDFDVGSIERLVAAERTGPPGTWLAEPNGYQDDGHVRRDSESIRLIAYASEARVLYATDGCNACRHTLEKSLETSGPGELEKVSRLTQLPLEMLQKLVELVREA